MLVIWIPFLWRTALQAAFVVCYLYRGRCPRLLMVVPSRHRSACGMLVIWIPILIGHEAAHSTLLPGRQYAAGWGFILVYRLAIDAKTRKGDGGAD